MASLLLRQLSITELARDHSVLERLFEADPDSAINVTKHGRTLCIAMSEKHYLEVIDEKARVRLHDAR